MEFELLRGMFEFALTVQSLVKNGWEFKLEFGERRLGVSDQLIAKKGDKEITCYSVGDIEAMTQIAYREWEEQQPWFKK